MLPANGLRLFVLEGHSLIMNKSKPTCTALFLYTLKISAFTIGGGYVMIPMLREKFVNELHWISDDELAELTAIGQSAPGAIVLNASVLLGYRLLGLKGALSALLGTAIPPMVILSAVCYFYDYISGNRFVSAAFRGMRAGISAVIADTVVGMAAPYLKKDQAPYIFIMLGAFAAAWFFGINTSVIIIASGALGALIGALKDGRSKSL